MRILISVFLRFVTIWNLEYYSNVIECFQQPVTQKRIIIANTNAATSSQKRKKHYISSYPRTFTTRCPLQLTNGNNEEEEEEEEEEEGEPYKRKDKEHISSSSTISTHPNVETNKGMLPKLYSFGLNHRSSPSQRKAMGKSSTSYTTIHVCTHCGAEYIKWIGQCLTCKEWNTIQEMTVTRGAGSSSTSNTNPWSFPSSPHQTTTSKRIHINNNKQHSWLGEISSSSYFTSTLPNTDGIGAGEVGPIRLNDVLETMKVELSSSNLQSKYKNKTHDNRNLDEVYYYAMREKRLVVPNNQELNNVLGGGIMPGSLTLLGGDPGVGKSTLAIQIAASVASLCKPQIKVGMGLHPDTNDDDDGPQAMMDVPGPVIYVSGEENSWQVASRAARLGIQGTEELLLLCNTDADLVANIVASTIIDQRDSDDHERYLIGTRRPSLVVIDSIQTMICESAGPSAPGGVTQVKEAVGIFLRLAKATGIPVLMIGHVTKSGDVAGPKTVEHMVDTVLYLEGDHRSSAASSIGAADNVRILRATKNRFGSSDEVGVYQMSGMGVGGGLLIPVSDPSSFFLSTRMDEADVEGCAVSLILEGSRCLTAEVQALVTRTYDVNSHSSGRRTVDGLALSRVLLILAVLDKRYGIRFFRQDVYINIVGGIKLSSATGHSRVDKNGSDLAVAVALVSSLVAIPVRADTAFVGEMGLIGELRPVPSIEKRIAEAHRMGFSRIVIPKRHRKKNGNHRQESSISTPRGIEVIECDNTLDAINEGLVSKILPRRPKARSKNVFPTVQQKEWLNEDDFIITDDADDISP